MTPDAEDHLFERQGRRLRQTYAGVTVSHAQRERHKQRLRDAARYPSRSPFSFIPAEVATIAAVALLLVVVIAVWQSLEPRSDDSEPAQSGPEAAATARTAGMPFPPPESCPVDEWTGPEDRLGDHYPTNLADRADWTYSYFLDGSGISLNTRLGLLYEGTNDIFWLTRSYQPQDMTYSAERLDDSSFSVTWTFGEPFAATSRIDGETLTVRSGGITFTAPGCWSISATSQDAGLRRVVYVYPHEAP